MFFGIIILALFFAVNMGAASFAASFGACYGGRVTTRLQSGLLFIFFVLLGSVVFGRHVSVTLGREIMDPAFLGEQEVLVVLLAAGLSMFIANMTKIPQSTSIVTVATIAGVGYYHHQLNVDTIYRMIPYWVILPIASYIITYFIASFVYPPRKGNIWIYQKFVNQRQNLQKVVLAASCYSAFSVGTNNVPNVVGPLTGSGVVTMFLGLAVFGVFYGLGAFVFSGPLKTAGEGIATLGLLTASIISVVSGTLMLIASILGIPQSFVMLQLGAIFAIASLKDGPHVTMRRPVARQTFYTWTINPVLTFFITVLLMGLLTGNQ